MSAHLVTCTVAVPALIDAPRAALEGLEADLAFCHPAIRALRAIDPGAGAVTVDLDPRLAGDETDVRHQVASVVELSVRSYRFVEPQPPLWRHPAAERYRGGGARHSFVSRFTRELGPGQYALVGAAAQLRTWLDAKLRAIGVRLHAEPWHLPSIESTADLIPATGYLASHGPYVTFGYRLPCHFERVRGFADAARARGLERPDDPADLEPTGFILEPFVCHNVYRALRHARLGAGLTVTALGTCYRHEGFRFAPLLRQWEFSMRELVLAGDATWVAKQRRAALALAEELVHDLDLDATLEIATDPFFVSEAASARTFQAMASTKLELRLDAGDATTAACSLNLHGTHFTEPMDIRSPDGALLETACIAFGLERWMAAFVARWGDDPDGWPFDI